jgi:hypothetical protein
MTGTSEPPGPSGIGPAFTAGGLLDGLAPGPVLAGFAENAWADGLGTLSGDALVGVLQAWRRLASWAAAGEIAAVTELDRRRWAEVAAGADPHLAEHVGDELAASLTLTTRTRRRWNPRSWARARADQWPTAGGDPAGGSAVDPAAAVRMQEAGVRTDGGV